jgi:hypothetical protein
LARSSLNSITVGSTLLLPSILIFSSVLPILSAKLQPDVVLLLPPKKLYSGTAEFRLLINYIVTVNSWIQIGIGLIVGWIEIGTIIGWIGISLIVGLIGIGLIVCLIGIGLIVCLIGIGLIVG